MVIYATIFIQDMQIAEDLIQDLFVELWYKKVFRRTINNPKVYLFTSAKNKCLMYLRKKRPEYLQFDDLFDELQVNLPEIDEERVIFFVEKIIDELPDKRAVIIKLHFYKGLKYREIADVLGISLNTVKTQIRKALHQLREKLNKLPNNI